MTDTEASAETVVPERRIDKAQYIVCVVLVAVGAFLIYDALTLEAGFAKVDPIGPRAFPLMIGIVGFFHEIQTGIDDGQRGSELMGNIANELSQQLKAMLLDSGFKGDFFGNQSFGDVAQHD